MDSDEEVEEVAYTFADWIYRNLEAESEYLDSDEHIDEQLADSAAFEDTRYDEDGNEI